MRLKQTWTRPVIRRLDIDDPNLTPAQREAVEGLLKRKGGNWTPSRIKWARRGAIAALAIAALATATD